MLRRGRFLTGAYDEELGRQGRELADAGRRGDDGRRTGTTGNARCLGVLLDGRAQETGIRRVGVGFDPADHHQLRTPRWCRSRCPTAVGGSRWVRLIDTSDTEGEPLALRDFGHAYDVVGRSLLLFVLQPDAHAAAATAAERSFQRVVQAIDEASLKAVRFGFD